MTSRQHASEQKAPRGGSSTRSGRGRAVEVDPRFRVAAVPALNGEQAAVLEPTHGAVDRAIREEHLFAIELLDGKHVPRPFIQVLIA